MFFQYFLVTLHRYLTNIKHFVKRLLIILAVMALLVTGCQWHGTSSDPQDSEYHVLIERFDQAESQYLTSADFASLHRMRTEYPTETRILVEDVLKLGAVNSPDINTRLLKFFQDSTLQSLIADVEKEYKNIDDINQNFNKAFDRLSEMLPDIRRPRIYTQVGSLDQSVVVSDGMLGISLDKYLGAAHPIYLRYGYSEQQRSMMTRDYIVPDGIGFYLLSLYPLPDSVAASDSLRRLHMQKIQCVVNKAVGHHVFQGSNLERMEDMLLSGKMTVADFLSLDSIH